MLTEESGAGMSLQLIEPSAGSTRTMHLVGEMSTGQIKMRSMQRSNSDSVVCSGLLRKKGIFRNNWVNRLFVLTKSSLQYYKFRGKHERYTLQSKHLRGVIALEDIVGVETSNYKDWPNCFVVRVKDRKKGMYEYIVRADTLEDRERWMKHFNRAMKSIVGSFGKSIMACILDPNGPDMELGSPAAHAAKMLMDDYPVMTQLLRDMIATKVESDLIHILDQILGEVKDGASGEYLRTTITTAAEEKLESVPEIWTFEVKQVYGAIMKAVHAQPPVPQRRQSRSLSCPNPPEDDTGLPFNLKYTLGRVLGSGASSVVHIATHNRTLKQYAVKCISKTGLAPDEMQSLQQEVSIMKQLNHPHFVQLIDYFDETDGYYIVTPLYTGGELFDELVKRECFMEADARMLMRNLASAVGYLHALGIIHRDLKPENILLKNSAAVADVIIADFGFSKTMDGLNQSTTACGTPGYVAPEVVTGKKYGAAVDCWSLGVILYILLCGYPPFAGDNDAEILRRVASGKFSFDSPFWNNVSSEACDLVEKLLTVDPEKRLTCQGILEHPWIADIPSVSNVQEAATLARSNSDLTQALTEMRKLNLTSKHTKNIRVHTEDVASKPSD